MLSFKMKPFGYLKRKWRNCFRRTEQSSDVISIIYSRRENLKKAWYVQNLHIPRIMVVEKGLPSGRKPVCMEELFNILSEGKVHVRVEMDAADLKAFSDELIRRAKDELGSMVEAARKERMLSKAEVKELFGVCDATLWHWDKKGILKPVKTGNKVLYPEHEVRKALGQRNQIL